jgi:hypothetical protein
MGADVQHVSLRHQVFIISQKLGRVLHPVPRLREVTRRSGIVQHPGGLREAVSRGSGFLRDPQPAERCAGQAGHPGARFRAARLVDAQRPGPGKCEKRGRRDDARQQPECRVSGRGDAPPFPLSRHAERSHAAADRDGREQRGQQNCRTDDSVSCHARNDRVSLPGAWSKPGGRDRKRIEPTTQLHCGFDRIVTLWKRHIRQSID